MARSGVDTAVDLEKMFAGFLHGIEVRLVEAEEAVVLERIVVEGMLVIDELLRRTDRPFVEGEKP